MRVVENQLSNKNSRSLEFNQAFQIKKLNLFLLFACDSHRHHLPVKNEKKPQKNTCYWRLISQIRFKKNIWEMEAATCKMKKGTKESRVLHKENEEDSWA